MIHRLFLLPSLLFTAAVAGCASHSMRPGVWEFNFRIERIQNRAPLPAQTQEVFVEVEWAADQAEPPKDPSVQEVALISPLRRRPTLDPASKLPRLGIRSMYAEIEVHSDRRIFKVPLHSEKDWAWQLLGVVENPESIKGTRFDARILHVDNAEFEGTWSMQWVRDE